MNVEVIENSFTLIRPNATQFAHSFYVNLFQEYPKAKLMFARAMMTEQENKFIIYLVAIIGNIRDFTSLKNLLKNIAAKQLSYDVITLHYQMFGDVFLKTLESHLKNNWTLEVKQAWIEARQVIFDLIMEGTKENNSFWSSRREIKNIIARLRVEAIAQKVWQESGSTDLVVQRLMEDVYFQEIEQKFGQEKAMDRVYSLISILMGKGKIDSGKSLLEESKSFAVSSLI